jgi:hypothetical protein
MKGVFLDEVSIHTAADNQAELAGAIAAEGKEAAR